MWTVGTSPDNFRLLSGEDVLGDYARSGDWGEGHHRFCTKCGISTYGHGRKITPQEISGKGERRTTVAPDLDKMEKMKKGKKAPKFDRIDEGEGFKSRHLQKLLRDTGTVSRGEEDLSELELSSDDEY